MSTHTLSIIWWVIAISTLIAWDFYWRGIALWKAAQRRDNAWFIVLLIVNSVGILPIVYLTQNLSKESGAWL